MGHYLSEMDSDYANNRPKGLSDDDRKVIHDFYAPEAPGTGTSCPKCGAELSWNWSNADNLFLHINWHRILKDSLGYRGARL